MKRVIFLILITIYQNNGLSNEMILDKLNNPNLTNQSQQWKFITDQVMGGISTGKVKVENINGIK